MATYIPRSSRPRPVRTTSSSILFFHNEHSGKFVEVSKTAGNGFQTPYVGRGVAFADFDNDGFVDVVVANNGDTPLVLQNSGGNGNHFLNLRLVGTKSNRDAMGARIQVVGGGISQIREIEGGGSYLSQSDLRANFGLGKAAAPTPSRSGGPAA